MKKLNIEYYDDAWDYFDNNGGRDRFDLPPSVDIYNDIDYCLVVEGHDNHHANPHIGDLYTHKNGHWIANMLDKTNGKPYTVIITWHG